MFGILRLWIVSRGLLSLVLLPGLGGQGLFVLLEARVKRFVTRDKRWGLFSHCGRSNP